MNILKVLILAVLSACIISGILMIALPPKIQKKEEYKYWYFYSSEYYLDKITDTEIGYYVYWTVNNKPVVYWIRAENYPEKEVKAFENHQLPLKVDLQLVDTSTKQVAIQKVIQLKH